MKHLVISAILLLAVTGTASGQGGLEVKTLEFQPSSRNVRLTVTLKGRPQKYLKVEIFPFSTGDDPKGRFAVFSNNKGVVAPPKLPPGAYRIEVIAKGRESPELLVNVSANAKKKTSSFSIDLQPLMQEWEPKLAAAEKMEATEKVREFRGVIMDESGGRVPGAKIDVWPKGSKASAPLVAIVSHDDGHFSARLVDGTYVALFRESGLRSQVLVFEIARVANSKDLWIEMQIGSCT